MSARTDRGYAIALERIKAARKSQDAALILTGLGLEEVPPEIGQLTALTLLYLYGNELATLPPEIGQLTALTQLYLGGNQLAMLPPEIGRLTALTKLDLGGNQLATLPPEIGRLTPLTQLDLYCNKLATLPPEIGQLTALTQLDLYGNQLATLPPEIGQLTALTKLNLINNKLETLPPEIGQLTALTHLNLHSNRLATLPPEIGQLTAVTRLELYGNQLATLPPEIGQLTALAQLNLINNKLETLPSEIGQLTALTQLNLHSNRLSTLPPEIGQLTALTQLELYGNQLAKLPSEIGQLTALTQLNLHNNQLATLPPEIGQLTALTQLELYGNQLAKLPSEIGQLTALTRLELYGNQLATLPPEIGQLTALTQLNLHNNQLATLPPEIGQLTALTQLNLHSNQLATLPPEIGRLTQLTKLLIENNRLQFLPTELNALLELTELTLHANEALELPSEMLGPTYRNSGPKNPPADPKGILHFYFAQRAGALRPLNEVKVLVVGESEVGKTSLIRQLRGERHNPNQDKTHGIERHQIKMSCGNLGEVRLNIWDFGGQDIMHATHQFFLTHRSVYVLVLDSRQNERQSRIDYWLRLIASYGGNSPVIVVCNKADQQVMQLNWTGLQRENPQIKAYVKEVCCHHVDRDDRRKGIDELKQLIGQTVAVHVEEVDRPILKTWLDFKDELECDGRPFMSLPEYHQMAENRGLTGRLDRNVFLTLLHQLGSVLHFSEHAIFEQDRKNNASSPHVEELNVLDPGWVTGAIYKLLNDAELIRGGGMMDRGSMRRSLGDVSGYRYPPDKEDFIIAMMRRFEICFAFDGELDRWFLPDLLHKDEVDTGEWNGALRFRYQYRVLPGSVISRLMVRLHESIARHCLWRTGAKFKRGPCEALVRSEAEDTPPRVDIFVRGGKAPARKEFLALIRGTLEAIHCSFSDNLGVDEQVEMPGHPGVFVGYQRLLLLEEKGTRTDDVDVEGSLVEMPVRDALDLVTDREARNDELTQLNERKSKTSFKPKAGMVFNIHGNAHFGGSMTDDHSINARDITNSQVGQTLTNCTNMVQLAPEHRKESLDSLIRDVQALIERLPEEKKAETAENLETLLKQASKATPNREWYSLSAKGLLEAATWVKDFTGNISGTLLNLGKSIWSDFQLPGK